MVGPPSRSVKRAHRGRRKGRQHPAFGRRYRWPMVAWETWSRCIATGAELWFEKPGISPGPAARSPRSADASRRARRERAAARASVAAGRRETELRRRSEDDDAGVQAVDRIWRLRSLGLLAARRRRSAGLGQPSPWQIGFQQSATPVMDDIIWFHDFLLWIIVAITAFVLALLAYRDVKFNASANPTPSRTTHNTLIEVAWTSSRSSSCWSSRSRRSSSCSCSSTCRRPT